MEVLLANEYGFCFGVERAVEMVEDALGVGAPVRTLGPLIHNTQEMQRLECEGVSTIQDPIQVSKNEIAVIRAHGVTPQVQAELERRAARLWTRPARSSLACKGSRSEPQKMVVTWWWPAVLIIRK
jgi:4-hydroxy-3-methylbut-2-enyl diphosphate reductase